MKKRVLFVLILAVSLLLLGAMSLPLLGCSAEEDYSLLGTWKSETGSVTHFYQDGNGRTVDRNGEHEFTWAVVSLSDAARYRYSLMREHDIILSVYGEEHVNTVGQVGWGEDDYIVLLTFDDFPFILEFPFSFENRDTLTKNTMPMGRIFSIYPNVPLRLQWITLTRV